MRPRFRKSTIFLFIFVIALAVAGGAAFQMLSQKMRMSAKDIVFQKPFEGRDTFTVLVLGEDETYSRNPKDKGRSDTILVAAVDLRNKRVQGLSIPRDTRIQIPGMSGFQKINASYVKGGAKLTAQCVADLLGIPIDYYIKTNIAGLKKVVDAVGGVGIDVEKNMYYVDRRGGLYINLKKGYRHLNGEKALGYVRFRHDRMGDIWRIQRQQKFLRALARQVSAPANWTKLPDVIDQMMQSVETNMTSKDLLTLARLSKDVPSEAVKMATLPGVPDSIHGISYYVADMPAIPPMVDEMLRFQPPKPTVAVLNGSGVTGAAERLADFLRGDGYRVMRTGNAPRADYDASVVMAEDPDSAQIQKIADLLNCRPQMLPRQSDKPDTSVVVIIGRDYASL